MANCWALLTGPGRPIVVRFIVIGPIVDIVIAQVVAQVAGGGQAGPSPPPPFVI